MPTDRQIPRARFHRLKYGYVWCVLCPAGENDLNSNASSGRQLRSAGDARILKSVGGDAGDERLHGRADHLAQWRLVYELVRRRVAIPVDACRACVRYWDAWTLSASLTRSSSFRKCSKRRILGHSAQATSLLRIEGTTKCSRTALGFEFGSGTEFVVDLTLPRSD